MSDTQLANVCTSLREIVTYCETQRDALDPDSIEYQRYRIAALNVEKALDHLEGRRDVIIRNTMERSRRNLEAFDAWSRLSGAVTPAYHPERDYEFALLELRERRRS